MNRESKERIEEQLNGKPLWRSLDELADKPEFHQYLQDEFPLQAKAWLGKMDRRSFIRYATGTLALAGLAGGCRWRPQEKIVPYVKQPEDEVLGVPVSFATACTSRGPAIGILATSHENRPTKIEGNPGHPASLGGTDAITQASLYDLYDPDRSQYIRNLGEISSWDSCIFAIREMLLKQRENGGANVRILSGTIYSPTLHQQKQALLKMLPQAKWIQYEPVTRDMARQGAVIAFGQDVQPVYHFDKADRIVSLDSDFLMSMPGSVRYAKDFADRRRVREDMTEMNRLYSVASWPTVTSANADHHLAVKPSDVEGFALALASAVGVSAQGSLPASVPRGWFDAMVADLKANGSRSLVVPGLHQSPVVHAAAHAINQALGSQAVTYIEPIEAAPTDQMKDLAGLVEDMKGKRVEMLLILGANPVYNAPADLNFKEYLSNVLFKVHLGNYVDETAGECIWHIPETHYLENWSDAKAFDGTVSIVQPLVEPLYAGKSVHEFIAAMMGEPKLGYDIIRGYWQSQEQIGASEEKWTIALNEGLVAGTASPAKQVTANPRLQPEASGAKGMQILFLPDATIWDGRFSNNAWLQELPKPLTTLTWDNAAMIAPATAKDLKLDQNDLVNITFQGRTIKMPIWIQPGMPADTVCLHLGFGRTAAGALGNEVGFDTYALRTSQAPSYSPGVTIAKAGGIHQLVATQNHHAVSGSETMDGRDVVRSGLIDEYKKNPKFLNPPKDEEPDALFEKPKDYQEYDGYKWGMVIDTSACIGCGACVTACQSENNIPIVGKSQVQNGREMHWIRIDRYFAGGEDQPDTLFQPMTCMQCENAPCEPVCPVGATVHSHEGLNQMVYNRCIGTRYCSNNCPYKVRRFNFYKFSAGQPDLDPGNYDYPSLQLMANPDVTVRGRGVMEKCTYCVQRISAARIEAKKAGRDVKDGEIVTACQQACPAKAIAFGNIADAKSEVAKQKRQPHNYTLLDNLLTVPRTSYLAKLTNPNPEIKS